VRAGALAALAAVPVCLHAGAASARLVGGADAEALNFHAWSAVATPRRRVIRIYGAPRAKRALFQLRNPSQRGVPRVFLVRSAHRGWLRVFLPGRPNGSSGWIRRSSVRLRRNPYQLWVDLRAHRIDLWRRHRKILSQPIGIGRAATPTPGGRYFIVTLLQTPDPHGVFGPFAFVLSAHSRVFTTFMGGHGEIGIHGTNTPWGLGHDVSHGCIRMSNRAIRRLARILPLGTPVTIVR
jgi:L,D-transpeptidase catalytic domain